MTCLFRETFLCFCICIYSSRDKVSYRLQAFIAHTLFLVRGDTSKINNYPELKLAYVTLKLRVGEVIGGFVPECTPLNLA